MQRIEKHTLKDGTPRYKAIIRRKGAPMRTKTFRTKAQAAAWAKRLEVKIMDGRAMASWQADKKTLVVDAATNDNLKKSIRNVEAHRFLPPEGVNVYDLLRHDHLVVSQDAAKLLEARCLR